MIQRISQRSRTPSRRINEGYTFQQHLNNKQPESNNRLFSRLESSPLKAPLDSAISKLSTGITRKQQYSPNRMLQTPGSRGVSSSRQVSYRRRFTVDRSPERDEDAEVFEKLHPQVMEFLKKYFDGENAKAISTIKFVDYLTQQFRGLWTQSQAKAILPEFVERLLNKLGPEVVQLTKLYNLTENNGLIGLILNIFKELKQEQEGYPEEPTSQYSSQVKIMTFDPKSDQEYVEEHRHLEQQEATAASDPAELQNLKNIIQEFTEGLYKSMENDIYAKVNTEMRRLVMQYKEAESLLITLNSKITQNIDKLCYQRKKAELERRCDALVAHAEQKTKSIAAELEKERIISASLKTDNQKLQQQNKRLNEMVEKLQNHFIKIQEQQIRNPIKSNTGMVCPQAPLHQYQSQPPPTISEIKAYEPVPPPSVLVQQNYVSNLVRDHSAGLIGANNSVLKYAPGYMAPPSQQMGQTPTVNFVYGAPLLGEPARKGISTTLLEKQNQVVRSVTPTRTVQRISCSPNRLMKPR